MSKYDQLLDLVTECSRDAFLRFDVDQLDHLVRHAGVGSPKFRDEFLKHIETKTRKDASEELRRIEFNRVLDEIEGAERRAWDRRARRASSPNAVDPLDEPVQLADLTIQQLIDCQLLTDRQRWLTELDQWQKKSESRLQELHIELNNKKQAMIDKIKAVEERLVVLKEISSKISTSN